MTDKNPFDLTDRSGGPSRPHKARTWTAEEQAEKLSGYLEIEPRHWDQIGYGTHLRYYTKAEGYRPGGFVLKNPFDTTPQGGPKEKRFFKLQNGFDSKASGYAQWIVAYEDLSRVYIKPGAEVLTVLGALEVAVRGLNENIRKVAEHQRALGERIARLER